MKQVVFKYFLVVLFFGVLLVDTSYAQCSMCRAVVESDANNMGKGINNGILYLMGFPYIIMLTLGVILFRKVYKDNKKFAHA